MRRASGFTLVEMVVSLFLLAAMLSLMYSGLSFAVRSWDAGEAAGRRTADRRIGENFLRRELMEIFPMRWKDPVMFRIAFQGETDSLRFVSRRAPGVTLGGLSLVGLTVEDAADRKSRNLVMRRAPPDDEAKDFAPLDKAEGTVLLHGIDRVEFAYFGAENDFTEPRWVEKWEHVARLPQVVRMRVRAPDGTVLPDFMVRVMLSEEAGCLENTFQRGCRPRRP